MNKIRLEKYIGCALLFASLSNAAGLSISTQPLYVTQPLAPNVIISPVYNSEYNEVSLRNAPWTPFNDVCNAGDMEQPCNRTGSLWATGAPFFKYNTPAYGWRVTPWPGATQDVANATRVTSTVSLYPNDEIVLLDGTKQFKPLDSIPGVLSFVTEDQYPGPSVLTPLVLNPVANGKVSYSRSDLNYLYFNKGVADSSGYAPWPDLGTWSFTEYQDATQATTPYYHPTQRHDLVADLATDGSHWSRYCHPTSTVQECRGDNLSTALVDHFIGQYWKYGTGNVWNSASYTQTKWPAMSVADKKQFAHWFTYWRSADLASRGMMARLVDTLGANHKDLLGKLRLGIFHAKKVSGVKKVGVEFMNTETELVRALADIIYSQDNVFTTALLDYDFGGGRRGTYSIWDPYATVDYFKTQAPYRDDPRDASSTVRSCRRNYEIVLTPDYTGLRRDNAKLVIPRSTAQYSGNYDALLGAPYADNYSNTLGDVGAYGWATDLIGLENNLLKSKYDQQTAQHLVRYVIGPSDVGIVFNQRFGSYDAALDYLTAHPASEWPYDPGTTPLLGPALIDELWHMALNSRGYFYGGENVSDALDKLLLSLNDILVNNVSGSSVATNTTSLSAGSLIYQATVESDWKGHLRAFPIIEHVVQNTNTKYLTIDYANPLWDLAEFVSDPTKTRKIFTFNRDAGVMASASFKWASIGTVAQDYLKSAFPTDVAADKTTKAAALLNYLRGVGTCEDGSGTICNAVVGDSATAYSFRRRSLNRGNTLPYNAATNANGHNVLGDIANSSPWLVPPPAAGISNVDYPGYNAHRILNKDRKKVLYVGANDGMLHAVLAEDSDAASAGSELFAYVPSFVMSDLHHLANSGYAHRYYVDGSPFSAEVDLKGDGTGWSTVLAGGVNRGGKGYYLLNVTDPVNLSDDSVGAAKVFLWEFANSDDADLHYTFNMPAVFTEGNIRGGQSRQIVLMNNNKWALVVGNGYPEDADKQACLFILYLSGPDAVSKAWVHGTHYRKICAGSTSYAGSGGIGTNGLSTPAPYDSNGDGKVDLIYAGDLNGNVWRFDVTGAENTWAVAYSGHPLFIAKNSDSIRQPIIAPPIVAARTIGTRAGFQVLFGTGKFIENQDIVNNSTQSFYGIWDRGVGVWGADADTSYAEIGRGNLYQQTTVFNTSYTPSIRTQTARNSVTYCSSDVTRDNCPEGSYLGWYWDMLGDDVSGNTTTPLGERMTGLANLVSGVIIFNTFYPGLETYIDVNGATQKRLDPCQYGGNGWIMGLNAENGYMEDQFAVFDINLDGVIAGNEAKSAGVKVGAAIGGTAFARGLGDSQIGIYSPTGKDTTGSANPITVQGNPSTSGRVSWYELVD